MANRIKGITIEIGGDTTKLDKALRTTDVELAKVQKDLRDVERLLKLDPTNVELLAQKQRLLAQQSELAAKRLDTMETAASQLDKTLDKSKIDDFNLELDLTKARAQDSARQVEDFGRALEQMGDSADNAADSLDDTDKASRGLGDGFSVTTGAIASFAGGAMTMLLDAAVQAAQAIWNLDEATAEYRESMAMLNTAYETAGFSQETATEAYRGFFAVLGDTDRATEASQLLAQLATSSQDISTWVNIAAGAYGTFGDSLPIESLIEAANETAKTGEVTGVLADALNWVGLSEDEVNASLAQLGDETNRAQMLMSLLASEYNSAADAFYENNASIIAARDAQADMDEATGTLGQAISDLKTNLMDAFGPHIVEIINAVADAVQKLTPLINAVAGAIGFVIDGVMTLVGWIGEAIGGFMELIGLGGNSGGVTVSQWEPESGSRASARSVTAWMDDIPALAAGAIIPPNNPFLAVLGDNTRETEIVAPYSAIKQAAGEAIAERGGSSGPITIYVKATDSFTRNLSFSLADEQTRRGPSLVNR